MFILIPWQVDVPQDRWPVANWLIILATVGVFFLQVPDLAEAYGHASPLIYGLAKVMPEFGTRGVTEAMKLNGWSLKGLFGYMWLHGGFFHLGGNMLFLWLFGNAVCAKIGNIRYLFLYILMGMAAAFAHLLFSSAPALGASGAVNGVVGMYLVLFYQNDITCLFAMWLILPYVRWFAVSGIWLILFWLFWDIVGALGGGSGVAYFAHLGGFGAGFVVAWLMCRRGWITMERYEKSLVQMWEQRRSGARTSPYDADDARLGLPVSQQEQQLEMPAPGPTAALKPIPLPFPEPERAPSSRPTDTFIRTACGCGREIKVSRQYAGRTVRCPACREHVVIPHKTDCFGPVRERASRPPMGSPSGLICLTCRCGKRIKVPARYAGRTGKCPQCGVKLRIPNVPA